MIIFEKSLKVQEEYWPNSLVNIAFIRYLSITLENRQHLLLQSYLNLEYKNEGIIIKLYS